MLGGIIVNAKNYLVASQEIQPVLSLVHRSRCKVYDLRHRVDTCGSVPLNLLTIHSENAAHGVHYDSIHPNLILEALHGLGVDYRVNVFVDFGCGKGRALLVASEFPFKKIVGVEYAKELHDVAVRNIRAYRSRTQRCQRLESVLCDATEYEIPSEPAVLYFFNPFRPPVMVRVLENIQNSLKEHPRQIMIMYFSPFHDHLVMRLKGVQRINQHRDRQASRSYSVLVELRLLVVAAGVSQSPEPERP